MIINKRDAGDLQTLAEKIISEFGLPVVIKAATQGSAGSQHFFAKLLTEADSVISLAVYCITQNSVAV